MKRRKWLTTTPPCCIGTIPRAHARLGQRPDFAHCTGCGRLFFCTGREVRCVACATDGRVPGLRKGVVPTT